MESNLFVYLFVLIIAVGVVALLMGAFTGDGGDMAGGNAVTMRGQAFNPRTLTVPVNTAVTWTNDDNTAHTVTEGNDAFDSGILQPGQTFTYTFTRAGTYNYVCVLHPGMEGQIVVR